MLTNFSRNLFRRLRTTGDRAYFMGPLLVRLTLGVVFIGTGWGKLQSLPDVSAFFASLHIPAPGFHARLVAITELVGGILMLVGLGTRLVSLPLAFTMLVAILTAKRDQVDGVISLLGFEEWSYLVMFLWLAVAGAGAISLDALWTRWHRPDQAEGSEALEGAPIAVSSRPVRS